LNDAVDAVAHRGGEHLAVGDVELTVARNRGDAFDREVEFGTGSDDPHFVGFVHAVRERLHRPGHFGVVHGADVEVEILEVLGAAVRLLGH